MSIILCNFIQKCGNDSFHLLLIFHCFRCWVSGWGKNDFNGVYQTIQKEVDVPILSAATCQAALAATRLGSTFVFDANSFICAGGEIGKDACTVCIIVKVKIKRLELCLLMITLFFYT